MEQSPVNIFPAGMEDILARIADAFVALDNNWCYTYMNKKAGEIFNSNPKEVIGKYMWPDIPEGNHQIFYKACHQAKAEQRDIHVEEYYPADGKWYENHIYPSPKGLSIFIRNITERKDAELKLITNEKKFKTLLERCTDGLTVTDFDGVVLDMSPSGNQILGYDSMEIVGKIRPDLIHPEDVEKVVKAFNDLKKDPSVIQAVEYRHKMPDGKYKWLECSYSYLLDHPHLNGIILNYRDITERKKADQELKRSELRYRRLFESAKDGILILNAATGRIVDANPFLLTLVEYSEKELLGKELWEIGTFKDIVESKEAFLQLQKKKYIHYDDLPLKSKSGKVIDVEFISNVYLADGQKVIQCNIRVITESKKTAADIKNANDQLRQLTAHLHDILEEERTRIGREIHDDLGQQLTAIKMDVVWIDKKISGDLTTVKSKLKNINTLLDSSNLSVRNILNELRPAVLDNYNLINALEWQGHQFTENTGIPLTFSCAAEKFNLDPQVSISLFRIFQEAITNIKKYAAAKKVTVVLAHSDDMLVLKIKDNGKGFNTEILKTQQSFGILGMKERVTAAKGKFELISSPGKGTKIIISIPYTL